jgi:hypothetical protein
VKRTILILGISLIALLMVGGVWLYAQQQPRPVVSVPATMPHLGAATSAIPQVVVISTSSPPTSAAASTTPTVGTPVATPSMIIVNTSTPVTVTVQITNPTLIPDSVNLLLLGATSTQPTILGVMQSAGNGTYHLETVFNETVPGQIQLEISAAFQGELRRVISPILQIPVWSFLTDTTAQFAIIYPPNVYLVNNDTSTDIYWLDSSPSGVAIGGTPDEGSSEAVSGYRIAISATSFTVTSTFNINQYLATEDPYSQISSVIDASIGGVPGYIVTFAQEENAGHPDAIVYHNGYVYEIVYVSTDGIPNFSDQPGLNTFDQILQTFTFTQ